MRRPIAQIVDEIERLARNKLEPRDKIVRLCDDARRTLQVRFETSDPIRDAVMRAVEDSTIDDEGLVHLDGDYMTTVSLMLKAGITRTPAHMAKVGKALSGLGYVRLARTRVHPQSRWFAPRVIA